MTLKKLYRLPKGANLIKTIEHPNSVEYVVSYAHSRLCPQCEKTNCVIKGHKDMSIHHLPLNDKATFITFSRNRYRCKDCNLTFYDCPDWAYPEMRVTTTMYDHVHKCLMEKSSQVSIADACGISPKRVSKILNNIKIEPPIHLPEIIGIDEFTGNVGIYDKKKKKFEEKDQYLTSICDLTRIPAARQSGEKVGHRNSCVMDVIDCRSTTELKKYFMERYSLDERKKVKYFCCDMFKGFTSVAKYVFPNAQICYDMFHVVERLNKAINETRNRIQNDCYHYVDGEKVFYPDMEEVYKLLKRSVRLLTMNEVEKPVLTNSRKDRLDKVLAISSDLKMVYQAVQEFHAIRAHIVVPDVRPAMLTDWINDYKDSTIPELNALVKMIQDWRYNIQNSWKYLCSNASCEGMNREIKDIKRNACGYHYFKPFRTRILLCCGDQFLVRTCISIRREKETVIRRGKKVSA